MKADSRKPDRPRKLTEEEKQLEAEQVQVGESMRLMNQNPQMVMSTQYGPDGKPIGKAVEISPRTASLVGFDTDSKGTIKPHVRIYHESPTVALAIAKKIMAQALRFAGMDVPEIEETEGADDVRTVQKETIKEKE